MRLDLRPYIKALALATIAVLAFATQAQSRVRVGESVHDKHGNLLWSNTPCPCGDDCRCESCDCNAKQDAHVKYRSVPERKAFLIWIWNRRNPERPQPQPTDPAVLQALSNLQANQNRLIELLIQMQNKPTPAPAEPKIIVVPRGSDPLYVPRVDPDPRYIPRVDPDPRYTPRVDPDPRYIPRTDPDPRYMPRSDPDPRYIPRSDPGYVPKPGQGKGDREPHGVPKGNPVDYQTYTKAVYPVRK